MSSEQISQKQIAAEIELIPKKKHQELYELIRNFRIGLEQEQGQASKIMEFAGSWEDISEESFNDICEEIKQRRQTSSFRRFDF